MFFEYESLVTELDSLQKGLVAYENCSIVSAYCQKYGYNEHLRFLIGDESLVSSIIEAGANFITWLKKKIGDIINAMKRFFTKSNKQTACILWIQTDRITRQLCPVSRILDKNI